MRFLPMTGVAGYICGSRPFLFLRGMREQLLYVLVGLVFAVGFYFMWFNQDLIWFRGSGSSVLLRNITSHLRLFDRGVIEFAGCSDYGPTLFFLTAGFLKIFYGGLRFDGLVVLNMITIGLGAATLAGLCGRRYFGAAVCLYLSLLVHYPFVCSFTMEVPFPFLLFGLLTALAAMRERLSFPAAVAAGLILGVSALLKDTFILYCFGPFVYLGFTCTRRFWPGLLLMTCVSMLIFFVVPDMFGMRSFFDRFATTNYLKEIVNEGNIRSYDREIMFVLKDNVRSWLGGFVGFSPAEFFVHALMLAGLFYPKNAKEKMIYLSYFGFVGVLLFYPSGKDKIGFYYPMFGLACAGAARTLSLWSAGSRKSRRAMFLAVLAVPVVSAGMLLRYSVPELVSKPNTFYGVNVSKLQRAFLKDNPASVDIHLFSFREEMRVLRFFSMFDPDRTRRYRFMSVWPGRRLASIEIQGRFRNFWRSRRKADTAESVCAVLGFIPDELEDHVSAACSILPTSMRFYVLRKPDVPAADAKNGLLADGSCPTIVSSAASGGK